MIEFTVNGCTQHCEQPLVISELLQRMALEGKKVAVERNGEIVGYEEPARDGAIIRDLDGRNIGGRFSDLRSRGTNSKNKGLTIVLRPADAPKVAATQPRIWELVASLSRSDLRRIQ